MLGILGSAFLVYGVLSGLSGIFVLLVVPETKGMTLEEVGRVYAKHGEEGGARRMRGRRNRRRTGGEEETPRGQGGGRKENCSHDNILLVVDSTPLSP